MSMYSANIVNESEMAPRIVKFPQRPGQQPIPINKRPSLQSENPITKQFALQLLEAEMQLDSGQNITQTLVKKLFELYRTGIEHYNQRRSVKEFYFRKRLEGLTNNPIVLGALHESETGHETFYKKKQIQKLVEINQKQTVSARDIMHSVMEVEKKVQKELDTQVDSIQKRIHDRRQFKKSMLGDHAPNPKELDDDPRKKLTKTMIDLSSTNQGDDMSKYFVDGNIQSYHET